MMLKKADSKDKKLSEKYKHGEIRQVILSALGLGILLGGTFLVSPTFPIAYSFFSNLIKDLSKKNIPKRKIARTLKVLEKREIISLVQNNGEVQVYLKNGFFPLLLKYSLKPLLELKRKNKKWDGRWFLVFFDVPEKQRNKRIYLRKYLKYIGFYPYQQSVYIFPYACEEEIGLIKKIVEGASYISYVVAEKIENEKSARIHFQL